MTAPVASTVDMEEVLANVRIDVVNYLEQHKDEFRGEPGRNGQSLTVQQVADYIVSNYGDRLKDTDLEARVKALEEHKRRVVWVDGKNIIDDETYGVDEPIVLDIRRVMANE